MMFFSYKVEHDFGLAPNPFGGYCTIAVCKGGIRGNNHLKIGDWIIGTGSRSLEKTFGQDALNHLIYAMKLEEKISFDKYWNDPRFEYKKPNVNGSLVQMYGDNFYHRDKETNSWIQENSAHSLKDGTPNEEHVRRDTNSENVLISKTFFYFGDTCPKIPEELLAVCSNGRNVKSVSIPNDIGIKFITWLTQNFSQGIHGDPINWIKHEKEIIRR